MPQQDAFDSTPATPTTPAAPTQDAFDQPTPQAAPAAAGQQDAFDQTPTPTEPPKPAIPAGMLMGSDGKLHSIPNDYLSKLEDKVSSGASGVEQGAGDVWDAIKGMVTHPINTAATALGGVPVNEAMNLHNQVKESVPLFHAYEQARSQGKGVWDSLKAASEQADKQSAAQQLLKQRMDDFKKNPTQATTRAVTDAAAFAASLWAGNKIVGAVGDLLTPTADGAAIEPVLAGRVKNIIKGGQPNLQSAINTAGKTATSIADARTAAAEAPAAAEPELSFDMESSAAPDAEGVTHHTMAINKGDEHLGILNIEQQTPDSWTIKDAALKPAARGQGVGPQAYEQAFKEAADSGIKTVESDTSNTSSAASVWEKLMKAHPDAITEENGQYTVDLSKLAKEGEAVASEAAPKAGPTGPRTALEGVSKSIRGKAQGIYKQLDNLSGGRWQRYEDAIDNLNDKMEEVNGVDDDKYDALETKRNDIQTSQAQMIEDMKGKGLDPKVADEAVAHYKQAMALKDVDADIKASTAGDVRVGGKEVVDPKMLVKRLQKRFDSGRLAQGLGEQGAKDLLKSAYDAVKAKQYQTTAKWAAAIMTAGYGGHGLVKLAAPVVMP